jgi:predicted dehydrogenase
MRQGDFRVAIIGLGAMGHHHAEACLAEPQVALIAGCDIQADRRAVWGARFGVPEHRLYASYEEMLDRERLDIVIVATPVPAHCAAVLAAARRGVHVLCEKPPALCLREADEMVAACAAAGVKLAINHIKRGSNGNAIARRLLAAGAIGEPYLLRGEAKGRRWAGSELMEMGTHLFDWLRLLAGDPVWVFAHIVHERRPAGREDIVPSTRLPYSERDCGLVLGQRAYCSIGFSTGLHADVGFLMQPSGKDTGYGFDIVGTEGTLALRRSVGTDLFLCRGPHRGPLEAEPWEHIPVDEGAGIYPPGTVLDRQMERLVCQRRLLRDLLQAIVEDREPLAGGRDGVAALELVMAVWQSHREGRPVQLPMVLREHPLEQWIAQEASPRVQGRLL